MLKSVSNFVISAADRLGYDIVPKWRWERSAMAKHLRILFQKYDIATVFDVGANVGNYGGFLRDEVGYNGKIISIEPVGQMFKTLEARSRRDPLWKVMQIALGAENGSLPINVTKDTSFSSFLSPSHSTVSDFVDYNVVERVEIVTIKRFEDLFSSLGGVEALGRTYLKLDTQGFDLEALKGAGRAIEFVAAMQSEISVLPVYSDMPAWREAIAAYEAAGFSVSGIFPVTRDGRLRAVEFDCILVR